jgi:hypothetical protein
MVGQTGRYRSVGTTTDVDAAGRRVACLRRRFRPATMGAPITEVIVTEGARLDLMAMRWLGDATAFWQIADANQAMDPAELTEQPGRTLVIRQPPT